MMVVATYQLFVGPNVTVGGNTMPDAQPNLSTEDQLQASAEVQSPSQLIWSESVQANEFEKVWKNDN